jgi:hypothetical protein
MKELSWETGDFSHSHETLTDLLVVIHFRITMSAKTSIRDLRNHFPKVRHLLETQGEVLLTEKGQPRYRLTLYSPPNEGMPAPVDYWARLNAYQPKTLTKAQSRALHDENRGDR